MPLLTLTATTPGPCACCGIGNAVLYCRTRGGTATLCGYSEYNAPSTPPRKYRTQTLSGSRGVQGWDANTLPTCNAGPCGNCSYEVVSGSSTYDTSTCVCADSTTRQTGTAVVASCDYTTIPLTGAAAGCGYVPAGGPAGSSSAPGAGNYADTLSQTSWSRAYAGNCEGPLGVPGPTYSYRRTLGTITLDLTDEDTEDDAIARLLAGAGGTWSAYTQVGDGTGGTCLAPSCCLAQYQQRTSGFSFAYGEAQFKAVMSALDPLTNYVVTFQVYRRLQGSSDPFVLLLDSPFGFTSDASGNYTITDQDVPNLVGYETYVCCPFIYKP